jgi:hypothetical protein
MTTGAKTGMAAQHGPTERAITHLSLRSVRKQYHFNEVFYIAARHVTLCTVASAH